jgi:hypothetical protein
MVLRAYPFLYRRHGQPTRYAVINGKRVPLDYAAARRIA